MLFFAADALFASIFSAYCTRVTMFAAIQKTKTLWTRKKMYRYRTCTFIAAQMTATQQAGIRFHFFFKKKNEVTDKKKLPS